jgi:PIN domain nuclease of toxin-antitoxin system
MPNAASSMWVKMTTSADPLLLDTHVWIWLVRGEDQIATHVLEQILAAARLSAMGVSVMTLWELGLLDAKGRIKLNMACDAWVETALARSGAVTVPLTRDTAIGCHHLPGWLHSDPVDRILVATARSEGMTLVTRDQAILQYAEQGHVRALPC